MRALGCSAGAGTEYLVRRPSVFVVLNPELGTNRTKTSWVANIRRKQPRLILVDVEEHDIFPNTICAIEFSLVKAF